MNPNFLNVAIAMFVISNLQNNTAYITIKYADKISTPIFTCPAKVVRHESITEENFRTASMSLLYNLQNKKLYMSRSLTLRNFLIMQ
jgi:hypothetical protein